MSEEEFERRVAAALRAPVTTSERARARVMEEVRASARAAPPRRAGRGPTLRGTRHSIVGLALAAGIGSVSTLSSLAPGAGDGGARTASSIVIGDSVVATLRDTLRLVRLIFDDPRARRVSVVGDFNGWHAEATPLHREHGARWSATVALRDGAHRYAFVVDGTRWVPDVRPASPADAGHLHAILRVARVSN